MAKGERSENHPSRRVGRGSEAWQAVYGELAEIGGISRPIMPHGLNGHKNEVMPGFTRGPQREPTEVDLPLSAYEIKDPLARHDILKAHHYDVGEIRHPKHSALPNMTAVGRAQNLSEYKMYVKDNPKMTTDINRLPKRKDYT